MKNRNWKQWSDRLKSIDLKARTEAEVSLEDVMWLTDSIRELEEWLEISFAENTKLHMDLLEVNLNLQELRGSHREWESRIWALVDALKDALNQSEEDLEVLNDKVRRLVHMHIRVPDVSTEAAVVPLQGIETLDELSVRIQDRLIEHEESQAYVDKYQDDSSLHDEETVFVEEATSPEFSYDLGEMSFESIGMDYTEVEEMVDRKEPNKKDLTKAGQVVRNHLMKF